MTEQPYFDDSGEPSDAAGIFVRPTEDIAPLSLIPGLRFQPVLAGVEAGLEQLPQQPRDVGVAAQGGLDVVHRER